MWHHHALIKLSTLFCPQHMYTKKEEHKMLEARVCAYMYERRFDASMLSSSRPGIHACMERDWGGAITTPVYIISLMQMLSQEARSCVQLRARATQSYELCFSRVYHMHGTLPVFLHRSPAQQHTLCEQGAI